MGMTEWVLKMLHYRLRSLGVSQIEDLIKHADTIDSLQIIQKHLESNNLKYVLVKVHARDLISKCTTHAEQIRLKKQLLELQPPASQLIDYIFKEILYFARLVQNVPKSGDG